MRRRQLRHQIPIALDQCFLLGARPAFDLPLRFERFDPRAEVLGPRERNGLPTSGIIAAAASLMRPDTEIEFIGMTGIIAAVSATQDIGPECHPEAMTE